MNIFGLFRTGGAGLFRFANSIAYDADDSEQMHLRKSTAVLSAILVAPAAIIWGVVYFLADEAVVAVIPSLYTPLTILNIVVFRIGGRYKIFEFFQLSLNLLLPFFLMLALGGFVSSSGVVMWALVTPMGAIVYSNRRMSIFWFVVFIAAVVFGAVIDSSLDHANNVPV